jgi:hypothetical protein
MERHVKALLSALRQAVNEAILGSHDVNAALAALGRTGACPSLSVDVSLQDPAGEDQVDERVIQPKDAPITQPGELVLTEEDEEFLQSLGITLELGARIAAQAPLK